MFCCFCCFCCCCSHQHLCHSHIDSLGIKTIPLTPTCVLSGRFYFLDLLCHEHNTHRSIDRPILQLNQAPVRTQAEAFHPKFLDHSSFPIPVPHNHNPFQKFFHSSSLAIRSDPMKLMIQYLSDRGIRLMDLFRTFTKDDQNRVSRDQFLQGLKVLREENV